MTRKTRNWLITLLILASPFLFFLGLLFFWAGEPLPPLAPLPNPNGYDDLLKAQQMLSNDTGEYNETNTAQVQKVVAADAAALSLARAGLSNACRVPIQYSRSYISNHLEELAGTKRLARAFVAEGLLVEAEGRTGDAIRSYLDTIRLGNESSRGGLLIDELVGIAIEAIGAAHLQTLVPHLDAKTCRETAAALETLDARRQTWDEVMQQENSWSHAAYRGWRYELLWLASRKSVTPAIAATKRKFNQQEMRERQLMIDLAARAYELDKGHPPANLADLVPDYLKAVPQDPVTGTNIVYTP